MNKRERQLRRKIKIKKKIRGVDEKPRLRVFRSNRYIYAQLINDEKGITLCGISESALEKKGEKMNKTERAKQLGAAIAQIATEKKIKNVVFDRGSYSYHGRVKAFADGAREGGLRF